MKTSIEILKRGGLLTIQDGGRFGYRRFGIPTSGFMDHHAAAVANWLVGNVQNAPLFEMIQVGASFRFHAPCTIAITGADLQARIGNKSIKTYTQYYIDEGDILDLGRSNHGYIAYLAISGQLLAEKILNSCSTYFSADMGRMLVAGDEVRFIPSAKPSERMIPDHFIQKYSSDRVVRFIPQIEDNALIEVFCQNIYTVASNSNRMGVRLICNGERVLLPQIITAPIAQGCIQLPPSGDPIVNMADGQTTGGYPIIGTIVYYDLPHFAQQSPGSKVKFSAISVEEAFALFQYHTGQLNQLFAVRA